MKNSTPSGIGFSFNVKGLFQIDGSKYIDSLKIVARNATLGFAADNISLSTQEFWDLIESCKNTKEIAFRFDNILLDEECSFSGDMEGSKLKCITFESSGNTDLFSCP